GLFRYTRPISGCFFRCPPRADGRLPLSALGLCHRRATWPGLLPRPARR
ncbi:hypothetical protein AB2M69_20365, partial [Pseudomonas aeruginosa]